MNQVLSMSTVEPDFKGHSDERTHYQGTFPQNVVLSSPCNRICDKGTLYMQGYFSYRDTFHTGILFIQGYFSYRDTFHTGILFIQGYFSYRDTFHTGILFIQGYFSYRDTFHTGILFIQGYFPWDIKVFLEDGFYCNYAIDIYQGRHVIHQSLPGILEC